MSRSTPLPQRGVRRARLSQVGLPLRGGPLRLGLTVLLAVLPMIPATGIALSSAPGPSAPTPKTLSDRPAQLDLITVTLSAQPSNVSFGGSVNLTTSVSGGFPPYTYWYLILPTGCISQNVSTLACTPTEAGTHGVRVQVNDTHRFNNSGGASFNVSFPTGGPLSITYFAANPSEFAPNAIVDLRVATQGGTPPLLYNYSGLPPGCASQDQPQVICRPTASGTYHLGADVTDSKGQRASATAVLVVATRYGGGGGGPLTGGGGPSLTPGAEAAIVAAAIVLVVALVGLWLYRRRRRRSTESGGPASAA